jgi:sulfonate transport system permease protein
VQVQVPAAAGTTTVPAEQAARAAVPQSAPQVAGRSRCRPRRRAAPGGGSARAIPFARLLGPLLVVLVWWAASALRYLDPRILPPSTAAAPCEPC